MHLTSSEWICAHWSIWLCLFFPSMFYWRLCEHNLCRLISCEQSLQGWPNFCPAPCGIRLHDIHLLLAPVLWHACQKIVTKHFVTTTFRIATTLSMPCAFHYMKKYFFQWLCMHCQHKKSCTWLILSCASIGDKNNYSVIILYQFLSSINVFKLCSVLINVVTAICGLSSKRCAYDITCWVSVTFGPLNLPLLVTICISIKTLLSFPKFSDWISHIRKGLVALGIVHFAYNDSIVCSGIIVDHLHTKSGTKKSCVCCMKEHFPEICSVCASWLHEIAHCLT